jgi:hypothetical protein
LPLQCHSCPHQSSPILDCHNYHKRDITNGVIHTARNIAHSWWKTWLTRFDRSTSAHILAYLHCSWDSLFLSTFTILLFLLTIRYKLLNRNILSSIQRNTHRDTDTHTYKSKCSVESMVESKLGLQLQTRDNDTYHSFMHLHLTQTCVPTPWIGSYSPLISLSPLACMDYESLSSFFFKGKQNLDTPPPQTSFSPPWYHQTYHLLMHTSYYPHLNPLGSLNMIYLLRSSISSPSIRST